MVGPKTTNTNSSSVTHTTGGSSSGSGAAVGDAQVPLALATQTAGSVIRPASFDGIYGLKPIWGTVSSGGQRVHSMLLDTLGWFGRSVADLAVLADVFGLKDDEPSTFNGIRGAKFAIYRTDNWPFVGEGTKKALDKAVALLGDHGATVDQLSLPYSVLKNVDQKCDAFPPLHQSASRYPYPEFPLRNAPHFQPVPKNRNAKRAAFLP